MISIDILEKAYKRKFDGLTWDEIGQEFNIRPSTLRENLLKNGFDIYRTPKNKKQSGKVNSRITKEQICLATKLKKEGLHIQEICKELNVKDYVLRKHKIHLINPEVERKEVYPFNINYFKNIDTEYKAYYLGLIAADGYVSKSGLKIELEEQDGYILSKLRDLISPTRPIYTYDRTHTKPNSKTTNSFEINSKYLEPIFNKYYIVNRKSFKNTAFPILSEEMTRHFIRGYFDGDGSVYLYKRNNSLRIKFIGNTLFINELLIYLINFANISFVKVHCHKPYKSYTSYFTIAKQQDIKNLYNYMYQSSNFYLIRKKEKFDTFYKNS